VKENKKRRLCKKKKNYRLDFAYFINGKKYDIEIDGDKSHSQKVDIRVY